MFAHASSTIPLQGVTTLLSHIRFPTSPSASRKEKPLNRSLNHRMYPARQTQPDHMVHQTAKPQQAGPRRLLHHSHIHQDADRSRAGRACPLPETPRKLHCPDRNTRENNRNKNLMKELPRKPVPRRPLQQIQSNAHDARSMQVRQHGVPHKDVEQAVRMSDMYTMIDDHLAWNMSSSNFEPARPGSSGTMFVDFDAAGAMEISYRHGVNKKLPTPPVPSKTTSKPTPVGQDAPRKEKKVAVEKRMIHPSYSSRHDSVISSGRPEDEKIDRCFNDRPLPALPANDVQRPQIEKKHERRSCPPQVHLTQRSSSPAPSQISASSSYHIAPPTQGSSYDGVTYTDPSGLSVRYHQPSSPHTPGAGTKPAASVYVSGFDRTTQYAYDYDGRVVHVHGSPTPSRPGSYTSEYFDMPAASYSTSGFRRSADTGAKVEKPMPHTPYSGARLPEPPQRDAKKRGKVLKFVQKLLHKLDGLGVMKEFKCEYRHSKAETKTKTWVENGYVT